METTNYKILIDKTGTPKLVEVPDKIRKSLGVYDFVYPSLKLEYEQALSTALADESKYIPFKDDSAVLELLDKELLYTPSSVCYNCLNGQHRLCNDLYNGSHSSTRCLCDHVNTPWWGFRSGQTFDLPDNIGVSFDWSTCENDICLCTYFEKSDCGYTRKLAILTHKENSAHSFTEGEASEQKDTADIKCPFCNQGGFDKPGLKYHINVYCVDYMNTEEL